MDIWFNILLFAHLVALVVGTTTNIAMPMLMGLAGQLPETNRPAVMALGKRLSTNSRGALVVLVITGVLMMLARYNGFDGQGLWFWLKMALVVALTALLIVPAIVPPDKVHPKVFGIVIRFVLLGIIFSAVMAFN